METLKKQTKDMLIFLIRNFPDIYFNMVNWPTLYKVISHKEICEIVNDEEIRLDRLNTLGKFTKSKNLSGAFKEDTLEDLQWQYYKDLKKENKLNITLCPDDPIVNTVVKKFLERSRQGMKKYGKSMDANNATTMEWINHAQEEAMDFVLYLERLKKDMRKLTNTHMDYV